MSRRWRRGLPAVLKTATVLNSATVINTATVLNTAMEATWLSVLLLAISATLAEPGVVMVGLPLFLFLYAARLLVRWLVRSRLDLGRSRLVLIYMVSASFLLALKVQNYPTFSGLSTAWLRQVLVDVTTLAPALGSLMMTLITVIWVWWRALQTPKESQVARYYLRQFQAGLVVVSVVALLAGRVGLGPVFIPWLLWFFFWGLLSIAANRLNDIAREQRIAVARYWLPITLAIALLVVGGGIVLSAIFAQGALGIVRSLWQSLVPLLELAFTIIAFPIGLFVEVVVAVLRPVLQPLLNLVITVASSLSSIGNPLAGLVNEGQRRLVSLPTLVKEALRWATVIAILGSALLALAFALRRRQAGAPGDADELHESVFSAAELAAGLRAWWQQLLARGRKSAGLARRRAAPLPGQDDRLALSVRQIYVHLMAMADRLGLPRPAAATPYEFLGDLAALLPESSHDLAIITDAYVLARYSGSSAGADLPGVQQAWQRVKAAGARLPLRRAPRHPEPPAEEAAGHEFIIPEYMIKEIQRRKRS